MSGKLTIPCTEEQYKTLIVGIRTGIPGVINPNEQISLIFQIEGNTGLRIGDVLKLRLDDIMFVNGKYKFNMTEQKTKKKRLFYVQDEVYELIEDYCKRNNIKPNEYIFKISVREVQKILKKVCDYYGYRYISTHSFRKRFATMVYECSGHDIELVRKLLQHSSTEITIKYLGIQDEKIEKVLKKITNIV